MIIASLIFNIAVIFFFVVACSTYVQEARNGRKNVKKEVLLGARFFTVQSNILASFVSLFLVICDLCILAGVLDEIPFLLTVLKLVATTSVMLTFLVVLCYLLPRFGLTDLFQGANFYMHVITPLLCLFSLILFEGSYKIPFACFFYSLIPIAAYSALYVHKAAFLSSRKARWDDMYLFNAHGKWYLIVLLMLVITAVISFLLICLHNLILG